MVAFVVYLISRFMEGSNESSSMYKGRWKARSAESEEMITREMIC